MPDRADATAGVVAVVTFLAAMALALFVPGAITSSGPSLPLFLILSVPIFFYAAYWAFDIRHALAVPLYRRQAFGIGFLALAFWVTILSFVLVPVAVDNIESGVQFTAFSFLFLVLLYWIDVSVLAARRSDPMLRDTLRWSKIRGPLWVTIVFSLVLPGAVLAYVGVLDPAATGPLNAGTFGGPILSFILENVVFNLPILVPIAGIIYLPAIALRSKWDRNLRMHFVWFAPVALAVLLIFFGPLAESPDTLVNLLAVAPLILVSGYCFYKSAKALVPLNRIRTTPTGPVEIPDSVPKAALPLQRLLPGSSEGFSVADREHPRFRLRL